MEINKIVLAADHAGFELKQAVKKYLEGKKYQVLDVGSHDLVPDDDYPTYMVAAAMEVAKDMEGKTRAVIFGGSGQGEAIVANRFPGVRAMVWYGPADGQSERKFEVIKLSRNDNDSNVLSIGARFVKESDVIEGVQTWLDTPFGGQERHKRRIMQIDSIE